MKREKYLLIFALAVLASCGGRGQKKNAMTNEEIAAHIVALEQSALVEWCHGNPSAYLELYDTEFTYFDPFTPKRWNLRQVNEMYERMRGMQNFDRFEIIDPRVQIHGEIAVLSFNYTSEGFSGVWNCTEVYRRTGGARGEVGEWKIIHNHWSDHHAGQQP